MQKFLFFLVTLSIVHSQYFTIDNELNIKQVDEENIDFSNLNDNIAGIASFWDNRTTDGWTYYTIKTSSNFPDWFQTFAAGYAEGYLTYDLIWDTWHNNIIFTKSQDKNGKFMDYPELVTDFLDNQIQWISSQVSKNSEDSYWQLVNITLAQLYGMYRGYNEAITVNKQINKFLTFIEFYTLTYAPELADILYKFSLINDEVPRCSFLLRLTEDNLFVSHNTWYYFNNMLRTYKVLEFDLKNPLVQTKIISFTSQPGYVTSQDDFYILDNGKFVAETSYTTDNDKVFEWIHYDSVPYWIRVTVANWAYDTQSTWAEYYLKYRSGTYNNQWLVVDFQEYVNNKNDLSNAENIVWMVEEFFELESYEDLTQTLLIPQGYVASYNVPYNKKIQKLSKNPTNYQNDNRAILFAKYAPKIQNLDQFKYIMRLNKHSDTHDYCEAIDSRCDLQYKRDFPFGTIDCKVTSDILIFSHQAWIQLGPTTIIDLPPFNWNDWPQYLNYAKGNPTLYEFPWVLIDPKSDFKNLNPSS